MKKFVFIFSLIIPTLIACNKVKENIKPQVQEISENNAHREGGWLAYFQSRTDGVVTDITAEQLADEEEETEGFTNVYKFTPNNGATESWIYLFDDETSYNNAERKCNHSFRQENGADICDGPALDCRNAWNFKSGWHIVFCDK